MFGYVRPQKSELRIREFTRYRSVYCGLCKTIGRRYGQLPRLAVSYDLTFLALLLLSLSEETTRDAMEGCILNPVRKKPVAYPAGPGGGDSILDVCADASILLASMKLDDDITDERSAKARAARILLSRARRRAMALRPALAATLRNGLDRFHQAERMAGDAGADRQDEPAARFGDVLGSLFRLSADGRMPEREAAGLEMLGRALGAWIHRIDAFDDLERDKHNGTWNPYRALAPEEARLVAETGLREAEDEADRIAAILPYRQDAAIIENIVRQGLPAVRAVVLSGGRLARL